MIVDSHAHIFPHLGRVPGARQREYLQRGINGNRQPVRRASDNAIVPHPQPIWRPDDPSLGGYEEVNFRVERFGRFAWTTDGVDYYKQLMPPSLVENACSPDYLVAEMDYAGIDWAILQNDQFYGELNDYFAASLRQYPGRLVGTSHIDEARAHEPAQLEELRRAASLGLRGIFYHSRDFWAGGEGSKVDEPRFDHFWSEVERLGLGVYWAPGGDPRAGAAGYRDQLRRWARRLARQPDLQTVVVGGLPWSFLDAYAAGLPDEVLTLTRSGQVYLEIVFPIGRGTVEEYPYRESLARVRFLYEQCGARALVWGSDVPCIMRYCTYAQSLDYLRLHADFMPPADLELIVGGNLKEVFGLPARADWAVSGAGSTAEGAERSGLTPR